MRYIKQVDGRIIEYSGRTMRPAYYRENGWLGYTGHLPLGRLDIVDGAVVERPAPEPPPRVFSKLAILEELEKIGLRTLFEGAVAASEHAWRWAAANEINEDYEGVSELLDRLRPAIRQSGADPDELLDRCVIGGAL